MTQAVDQTLQSGREAIARYAWREGFDLLTAADASAALGPEDLENLAQAAWWTGRLDSCIEARERAYRGYLDQSNLRRAALMALELAHDADFKRAGSIAKGWQSRAERHLAEVPESPEHGYLARRHRARALARGDLDGALEHARRTVEIGMRFGDRDLQAIGLHDQGSVLIARGQVDEGLALIDEATMAAVGGELSPGPTAIVYCNTIVACRDMADYGRAADWTAAAKRWCDRQHIAGFPGMCRVYRAEILRLRGAWVEAELEARRACEELKEFCLDYAAGAFYELGEIRLRLGDLPAAGEAFRQAHELGRAPQPGLSLLRLVEGKVEAALTAIKSALDECDDRLGRARLLPALVEIALAAGDLTAAQAGTDELEAIAEAYRTLALQAAAASARGALTLARSEAPDAVRHLRRAVHLWQEIDAPYEVARTRMLLAAAHRAGGDEEDARLELEAAWSTFERLGAVPDARRAGELRGPGASPGGRRVSPDRLTRTFMFTDIARSTALVEAIGDEAWEDLVAWHDQTLRSLFATHGGAEIDHAGDGFFVAFETASPAIECAVAIQRALADHRRSHGFSPQVRVGVHTAPATHRGRAYRGKGVHTAARIGALADAGEILASQETLAAMSSRFRVSPPRPATLKGISERVQLVSIEWQ
ncbi:MAG: adenylate/guanylate cyclase domain-containing protein [bacterium]